MDSHKLKISHWEIDSSESAYNWRSMAINDVVITTGGPFETYGKAVVDAMNNGFNPQVHHWIKINAQYTIHFGPGSKIPVIVPPDGATPRSRPSWRVSLCA
jgi:hypothetical protein